MTMLKRNSGARSTLTESSWLGLSGLVPAISTLEAPSPPDRDRRDQPGDDPGGRVDPDQRASEATWTLCGSDEMQRPMTCAMRGAA
jgi:hypothetical protein